MAIDEQSACPVQAEFDPLSSSFLADPFAVLASLPPGTPVFYAPSIDYYVVTRYADIEAIVLDEETYSAAPAQLPLVPLAPEAAQILLAGGYKPQHETLRYDPSVPAWRRVTTRPVTLGGVNVPQGAKLFLWLAASGRDASVFPQPGTFDLRRANATKTLAFGRGIHYCLGAALGRLEAQIALEGLTQRFPRLRLLAGQKLSYHPNISFRGPEALWVQAT
jgi:cytochrome P450